MPALGIDQSQFGNLIASWALRLVFIVSGQESVRAVENITAPITLLIVLALLGWA